MLPGDQKGKSNYIIGKGAEHKTFGYYITVEICTLNNIALQQKNNIIELEQLQSRVARRMKGLEVQLRNH